MTYQIEVLVEDEYNNAIESFGYCAQANGSVGAYMFVILVFIVAFVIFVGNLVCFVSRNDESVNNEVTYITLAMINFLQV
jgi:low affinity Fe/Cu permease